ncbi:MAG: Gfo/Idh/MocA family oxidoreductase [Candidatus Symbiothrix sp.]|jgi:predicted dehydrogenase|nr:Gfo/Idh/MocA family oxidoreductase [Candidatus Symbiothrix sp.]
MKKENRIDRRSFLKNSALIGALGVVGTPAILTSCSNRSKVKPLKEPGTYYVPVLDDLAGDGRELKAGLIGCGGRGSGAVFDFLNAANGVTVTALADTFKDKADAFAEQLKNERNIIIPEDKRFSGLDAYKQVIDSDVDVVIIATPPSFRPLHFKYATEKGKHSFLEKPVFVDPAGYRSIMATAKQAAAKNLAVITGTQRRHQRNYVESYKKIMDGLIGEITGGIVYWNQNRLWYRSREEAWSDAEWMIKDWVNWKWLSGDHIVEQHVHNIDVFTWFSGLKPVSAVGFGSRQGRVTGDQYDNFSVDFVMENGIHLHSMCRQINGCANNVSEFIQGTKGSWSTGNGETAIRDLAGNVVWKYDGELEKNTFKQTDPYVLEHVNWINHIRSNRPIDQASEIATPNMAAVMGRESAYTGAQTTWEQMTASPLDYTPADLNLGKMDMSAFVVPVPGKKD